MNIAFTSYVPVVNMRVCAREKVIFPLTKYSFAAPLLSTLDPMKFFLKKNENNPKVPIDISR
jgi:hypothetical protein